MITCTPLSFDISTMVDAIAAAVRRDGPLPRQVILARFPKLEDGGYDQVVWFVQRRYPEVRRLKGRRGGLEWRDSAPFLHLVQDLKDEVTRAVGIQFRVGQEDHAPALTLLDAPDSVVPRYVERMQTIPQILKATGLDYWDVVERLKAANVPLRKAEPDLLCPEYLHYEFHVRGVGLSKIAEVLGVEPIEVRRQLHEYGIPTDRRVLERKAA